MDKTSFPKPIFHKPLRDITGDTSAALILGQLIYLSNATKTLPGGWIRKPATEWNDFFGFERTAIERVNLTLKSKNLVDIKRAGVPCTNHYRIKKSEIEKSLSVCGIPANWIAEILQTGLRETSKQVSEKPANINSNKDIQEERKRGAEEKTAATATAFTFFTENGFGKPEGHLKSKLEIAINTHSEKTVIDAMCEAIENGVPKWKYVEKILIRWQKEGRGKNTGNKPTSKPIGNFVNLSAPPNLGRGTPKGLENISRLETFFDAEAEAHKTATRNAAKRIAEKKLAMPAKSAE